MEDDHFDYTTKLAKRHTSRYSLPPEIDGRGGDHLSYKMYIHTTTTTTTHMEWIMV